jgi:RecG-like helicase
MLPVDGELIIEPISETEASLSQTLLETIIEKTLEHLETHTDENLASNLQTLECLANRISNRITLLKTKLVEFKANSDCSNDLNAINEETIPIAAQIHSYDIKMKQSSASTWGEQSSFVAEATHEQTPCEVRI